MAIPRPAPRVAPATSAILPFNSFFGTSGAWRILAKGVDFLGHERRIPLPYVIKGDKNAALGVAFALLIEGHPELVRGSRLCHRPVSLQLLGGGLFQRLGYWRLAIKITSCDVSFFANSFSMGEVRNWRPRRSPAVHISERK